MNRTSWCVPLAFCPLISIVLFVDSNAARMCDPSQPDEQTLEPIIRLGV